MYSRYIGLSLHYIRGDKKILNWCKRIWHRPIVCCRCVACIFFFSSLSPSLSPSSSSFINVLCRLLSVCGCGWVVLSDQMCSSCGLSSFLTLWPLCTRCNESKSGRTDNHTTRFDRSVGWWRGKHHWTCVRMHLQEFIVSFNCINYSFSRSIIYVIAHTQIMHTHHASINSTNRLDSIGLHIVFCSFLLRFSVLPSLKSLIAIS